MNLDFRRWRYLFLLLSVSLLVPQPGIAQQQAGEQDKPLENSDVLAMRKAGIGEGVVVAAIKYAPGERLDGSAEAVGALRGAGVGEVVIAAVVERVALRQKSTSAAEATQVTHAKSPSEVKLFFTEKPTQSFREIGRVSASKFSTLGRSRKREAIDDELKTKALEMGGDAVINITEDFASVSGVVIAFQAK